MSFFFFLLDSLFFNKYSIKISDFFLNQLNRLEPIQPDHRASLYGALILEPKSYSVWVISSISVLGTVWV